MLKVIGAGFGRTGTHSLALALDQLGFGPCYNILEVSKNSGHTQIWNQALKGKAVDWDALFEGYSSTVEWPTVAFFRAVASHFPKAKVILTLRDPTAWFESANATIFDGLELSAYNPDSTKRENAGMARRLILKHTFDNKYRDQAYATKVFREHSQHVIESIPPERLLQYQVSDGWEPLCNFLDVPVPQIPFPRVNSKDSMLTTEPEWAKQIRQARSKKSKQ